jgi:hypothetical protein
MNGKSLSRKRLLGVVCAAVLCITLTAGIWPFHAPHNEVTWLSNQHGLHFGKHGSVVSSGPIQTNNSTGNDSCSLEIWLRPDVADGTRTIFGFYNGASSAPQFSVHQYHEDLLVRRETPDTPQLSANAKVEFGGIFYRGKPVFVTITSSGLGRNTSVYVDGALVGASQNLGLSNNDMTGQLVVANSPTENDSWSGQVLGLAIYGRALTPVEVLRHYGEWTMNQRPEISEGEMPTALYLFSEQVGKIVHNHAGHAPVLRIPEHYFVLHPHFLQAVWNEFRFRWYYWKDVGVNIVGFIPLGFFFCAYFSSVQQLKRAELATIALGLAISLTIEVLQSLLPTRESGTTDLLTNSLGTAVGTMLYRISMVRAVFAGVEVRT